MLKNIQRFTICMVVGLMAIASWGQSYQSTTDVIYGQNCFVMVNDSWTANGDKKGTGSYSWPNRSDAEVCYYLRVPAGYAKMSATFNTKASAVVRLRVTDPETKETIYERESSMSGSGLKTVQLMSDCKFGTDKWYRFALSSQSPSAISNIVKLEFNRESTDEIVSSAVFGAPSTHLWTTLPLDPMAPKSSSYDWAYEEVMYPSKWTRPATYVEAIATLGGYMGIQTGGIVLFSMWDDGDTDKNPYLPDYLKSTCMDHHPDIAINRFGGEGTGVQSMFKGKSNHTWKYDTWVQFLFNARPEQVVVTVKGSHGQDSTFIRQNTITTAWYKNADDKDWTYMATLRKSGSAELFSGWYSFLEDFAENGCDFTRAYYRNCYMRSAQSGKWYNISHFTYGHTDGSQNGRRGRSDWGHGVTDACENAFFMEQGGFFTKDHDSLAYAGIPNDQSCVDTINIQAKIDRVSEAIQKQARVEAALKLDNSGETYNMAQWEVVGYSDQSEEGDGDYGRAWQAIDGNTSSYWRNKWKNGGVLYPHWISMKAPSAVTVNKISLNLGSSYLYWPKHVVVSTSADGQEWTTASDTMLIAKSATATVTLPQRITSQYFKLEFVDSYGAAIYINEITLSTDVSDAKVLDYAGKLVENAGCFDSYPIDQTQALKEAYADGQGNLDQIIKATSELTANGTMLRYGNTNSAATVSSLRCYQLSSVSGMGKLICTPEGKLTLSQATTTDALEQYKAKVDVTRPENNWMLIRVEGYNSFYMYNPGIKKYLDLSKEGYLSDEPASIVPSFNAVNKSFVIRGDGKYLCLNPTSTDAPVTANTGNATEGAYFHLLDNFYLTPSQETVQPILDQCTDIARFPTAVRQLGNMLNVEQGVVGAIAEGEQRDYLTELYNNGKTTIDKRDELYKALEECKRLEFDPQKHVYRIKSRVEGNANAPYLTATNTPATSYAAQSSSNVAQIWAFNAKGEGFSPTSQSVSLGRLPSEASMGIATVKTTSGNAGKYYVAEAEPGIFKLATTQTGGIAYSAATAGKSEKFDSDEASFELEEATSFNTTLQSSGLKGINYAFDIIIPEDMTIYVVDHIDNGTAYLLRVYDRLPAGVPAIIKGNSYQAVTLQIAAPTESYITNNLLHGTYFAENGIKGTVFTLKTTDGGVFAKSAISNVSANSVYLLFDPADAPTGKITLDFSDEPCEVESVTPERQSRESIYDLQGNKVNTTQKGHIYIRNGAKVKQ